MRNFTVQELSCPCCQVSAAKPQLAERLQVLRDLCGFPLRITSGYRCQKHNAKVVGSSPTSLHTQGLAVDISTYGLSGLQLHTLLRYAYLLQFGGVGIYKKHIHIDLGKNRTWLS